MGQSRPALASVVVLVAAAIASLATNRVEFPDAFRVAPATYGLHAGEEEQRFLFEVNVGGGPVRKGYVPWACGGLRIGGDLFDDADELTRSVNVEVYPDGWTIPGRGGGGVLASGHLDDGDEMLVVIGPGPAVDLRVVSDFDVCVDQGKALPGFEPELDIVFVDQVP